jgi:hypothetical protein
MRDTPEQGWITAWRQFSYECPSIIRGWLRLSGQIEGAAMSGTSMPWSAKYEYRQSIAALV